MSDLITLRNLLELAKESRGGNPHLIWDVTDLRSPREERVSYSKSIINQLLRRPMTDMSMRDAYALGSTIAFLNLEIERLVALNEAQAKP